MFTWDENKNKTNQAKHGIPFEIVRYFDFDAAITDRSYDGHDGETRFKSIGYFGDRAVCVVWRQQGQKIRIISVRVASKKERALL